MVAQLLMETYNSGAFESYHVVLEQVTSQLRSCILNLNELPNNSAFRNKTVAWRKLHRFII